ncbi:MAG TPA: TIGR00730 family Rossman fold protein, partial [Anaerolineales bacterium]|nr:TIGR00730 family Rossman fold protein [Anaerolineales bacterium]
MSAARKLGILLAERGLSLVFGGGTTGLMGAVADGALEAGGEVIGIIIPSMNTRALAHDGLTRMDVTPGMHERKARMHELADGYIALPGGFGTFDELFETITWAQTGAHEKPVGLLNVRNYYAPLLAAMDHAVNEGFVFKEHRHTI